MLSTFERNASEAFILGAKKSKNNLVMEYARATQTTPCTSLHEEKRSTILAHQNLSREVKIGRTCISQLE